MTIHKSIRWWNRYDPHHLQQLEDRCCRPRRRRRPTWTAAQAQVVLELRERYPRWGKDKLRILLRRQGLQLSVSMVGRILSDYRRRGLLPEPLGRISARKRSSPRRHAMRKPKDYQIRAPGDLVQLDSLDVRPLPGKVYKQFTARDVVSRWDVLDLHSSATAGNARQALQAVLERMPFAVKAIQVDNGSEFMAEFEDTCAELGVRLFNLPPRSPKLNGCVERAQRTHTEEFYECTLAEPNVTALAVELRRWEDTYNRVRPHQALGYLTPEQFLQDWLARNSTETV
ncbi:MAG: integrase core domain-containing protein [Candidatus Dormibacter sp.]|uniref:integrase core domain-containing protein n=1 Tax=Candidatus Dormibacter sp. TaxID=2973982 RepID=UPI003D9BA8CB